MASPPHVKQWIDKEPRAAIPPELIYTMPTGYSLPVSRESLRASAADVAKAEAKQRAAAEQVRNLEAELAAADPAAKAEIEAKVKQARVAWRVARDKYGDVRTLMREYGLTLGDIKERAGHFHSAPVHPTQLYASFAALVLALFLDRLYWIRRRDGQVICTLLLVQPVVRYLLEVIRADNPLDTLGFTISQAIAIALTLVGLIGLLVIRKLPPRSPRAKLFVPPVEDKKPADGEKPAPA